MNHHESYNDDYLQDILSSVKTIAMVGASPDKTKFSYGVLRGGLMRLFTPFTIPQKDNCDLCRVRKTTTKRGK